MKILYLVHQFFPEYYMGTETFILNLALAMQASGHTVKILTYGFDPVPSYERRMKRIVLKEFSYQGLSITALRHLRLPAGLHHSLDKSTLTPIAKGLIVGEKPDLVHVGHFMRMHEVVSVLPALRIPYLMTLTDFFAICPKFKLITSQNSLCQGPEGGRACQLFCPEFRFRYIVKRLKQAHALLSNARALVCPSEFCANLIRRTFPDLALQVIAHGLSPLLREPAARPSRPPGARVSRWSVRMPAP